jgi:hypothetical protein
MANKENSPISHDTETTTAGGASGCTDFSRLQAGNVPLIPDGESMYTVPEKYRRTCLPLSEDFKSYALHWKARRSILDYLSYLLGNYR